MSGVGINQSVLSPAGVQASSIHALWLVMLSVCAAVFLAVLAALLVVVVRGTRRRLEEPSTSPAERTLTSYVGVAVLFVFHAPQKAFGWWGSEPFPPLSLRGLASGIELVASPLIAVGYLTSWAALVAAVEMFGAYLVVHAPRGGWPIENRGEMAVLYFLVFVYMAVRGGGAYSLDARQRDSRSRPILIGMAAAAAILICMGAYVSGFAADRARVGVVDATARGVRLFVTNEMSGDLSEIDAATGTVARTAPLGKRPRGIRISPDQQSLYVALSGSPNAGPGVDPATLPPPDRSADGIGEVDAATLRIKRIIQAGADPEQLDISPDGTRLYGGSSSSASTARDAMAGARAAAWVRAFATSIGSTVGATRKSSAR
jgi:YVTN family beta-propeller protein